MNTLPKHREISQQLLAEIGAGKYAATGRLPTEMELVQRFGVSRPTVARALRDLQAQGLIERRAGSGTYTRGQPGRNESTRQLGLLVPGLGRREIFEVICGELTSLARAHEVPLLWGDATFQPRRGMDLTVESALELCNRFVEQQIKGVFFTPFDADRNHQDVNRRIAEQLNKAGIEVILLDRDLEPFPHRSDFDLVGTDNIAGGCRLAEHLIKLGCQRIAFVAKPNPASSVNGRIAGVREALTSHKLEPPPDWIHLGNPEDLKFVRSLTAGQRWDAVVCANDFIAAQLLQTFEKTAVRVPRDLRLAGFDDAKHATLLGASLTTMRQPCRDIAITAFRAMLERINDPTIPVRSLLLTPQLIVRESCGAYLNGPGASRIATKVPADGHPSRRTAPGPDED